MSRPVKTLTRAAVAAQRAAARQWRIANQPHFDAIYGSEPTPENRAAARQWRIDNKPWFDAIYGPEEAPCTCRDHTLELEARP